MSYEKYENMLAPLETFDPKVFVPDKNVPQNVCDFILALSVAFNDFRDVFVAELMLNDLGVKKEDPISTRKGLRNGLFASVVRVRTGFVRELLKLISKSQDAIDHPAFRTLLKSLSKKGKKAWTSMFEAATNSPSTDDFAKALVIIRNKVSFHYDSEELGRGFREAFLPPKEDFAGRPFISRGLNLVETRFYFSDAAAQGYVRTRILDSRVNDFLAGKGDLVESINQALYELVTKFIQSRSAWERYMAGA